MSFLIIGAVTPTTARVWARGEKKNHAAKLRYRTAGAGPWRTETATLEPHLGFTTTFTLSGLAPDTRYECVLSYENGAAPPVSRGHFRTAPDAPRDLTFIVASCNFSKFQILTSKNVDVAWGRIGALAAASDADFMVHCGDQIYADLPGVPFPDLTHYQREYQAAWRRKPTAEVLAGMPHYMMLDDHEIFDGFANDVEYLWRPSQPIRDAALEAYRQYQHAHNPQAYPSPVLYYHFRFAGAAFFALDTRSERWKDQDPQMISALQMAELLGWLDAHREEPKFVVTSVPFVAEVRDRSDKWCGDQFRLQREQVIEHVARRGISRLCFLTGDMHCSSHLTMTVTPADGGAPLTVHELISSPINQVAAGTHRFIASPLPQTTPSGVTYHTAALDLAEFYGQHSNVMLVRYRQEARTVEWQIHRTKPDLPPAMAGSFAL